MTEPSASPLSRRIKVLQDAVARKIAAGEVIDRPQSVLRELIDNSLDAGATAIEVRMTSGGLRLLEVTDNGVGMTREDLELCWLPHTTSKIESEEDLNSLTSLGFRGEALASITACARVSILTTPLDNAQAWELLVEEGQSPVLRRSAGPRGTRVRVEDLFFNLPARKKFLKSSATEGTLCRRVLEEKALAVPHVSFTLWVDEVRRSVWPPQEPRQRIETVLGTPWDSQDSVAISAQHAGFALEGWAMSPPHARSDRRGVRIYANGRPLQEFSMVQAISYAFEGVLPGGLHPWAVLFVTIDPSLVDFNIHPAKREARFRNMADLHPAIVAAVRAALEPLTFRYRPIDSKPESEPLLFSEPLRPAPMKELLRGRAQVPAVTSWDPVESPIPSTVPQATSFRYLGQVLGVFLVVELGDELFLIDQHAAHERILFDRYRAQGSEAQELLFPRAFTLEEDVAGVLSKQLEAWAEVGVGIRRTGPCEFEVFQVPQAVLGREKDLIRFLEESRKPVSDVEKEFYASFSCRAALMDGDPIDPETARELIRQTLALEHARCPHGRPIWTVLSRQDLFERVGRVV